VGVLAVLGKALMLGLIVAGCQPDLAGDGGSTGMFGLFKGKAARLQSIVAPEIGTSLKRETTFPDKPRSPVTAAYDHCQPVRVAGTPPRARFVGVDGEEATFSGYRVAAHAAQPALALVNISDLNSRLEIWELSGGDAPAFVRQRPLQIDAAQKSWGASRALDAACLPGDRLAIGLYYANPRTQHSLYVYDIARNTFQKIGDAVLDSSSGAPERMFETWPVGRDSAVVLWHSGEIRVKAEVYVRERDHLLLYSPRHPQGLEVLSLGLDDGNIERWTMVGQTLWIKTVDARNIDKPVAFV
jgi:hypothetical protein